VADNITAAHANNMQNDIAGVDANIVYVIVTVFGVNGPSVYKVLFSQV